MNRILKLGFFLFVVKPLVLVGLGLNIVNRDNLPVKGGYIIAANHNSHLDTLILMSLFPISVLHRVRPVAAADYFLRGGFVSWFFLNVIGIIPIDRKVGKGNRNTVFDDCEAALKQGDILIIFPEGSRGKPEVMGEIKKGVYHLLKDDDRYVIPVLMRGLGMSLPKGTALLVPFNCDVVIGEPIQGFQNSKDYTACMRAKYDELSKECITHIEEL